MKNFHFSNKIFPQIYFIFLPVFLFVVLIFLIISNLLVNFWITAKETLPLPFNISSEAKLPIIKTEFIPKISSEGAIIMDADSKVVLYSKNPSLRFSSASTTKIMTALVALDYFKNEDILTVKQATDEGSVLGLYEGEQMTFENLLYALLLPSANDAALTIAKNYKGGEIGFVSAMNDKAEKLLLYNTHYSDPAGLTDSGDYTTPFDLARLSSFALNYETFKKIVSTKEKIISDLSGETSYDLKNLNELLGQDGITGIKTGYTKEAGQVLVTSKLEKDKTIIIIVMGSQDRFLDTRKLLDLVSNNLSYLSIHP